MTTPLHAPPHLYRVGAANMRAWSLLELIHGDTVHSIRLYEEHKRMKREADAVARMQAKLKRGARAEIEAARARRDGGR